MKHDTTFTRRNFFGQASCAAVGSSSLFSTLLNLGATNSAAGYYTAPDDEYKALVCLFLGGGNDSFNMLVPRGTQEYNEYQRIRADLALAQNTLLPIAPTTSDGREFGLHPLIPEIKQLFDEGDLGFMANVGTLVEPTTLKSYESGVAKLPLGLYSHSDQIMHWQTSLPDQRSATGWGGRMADLLYAMNHNDKISMNISLAGNNFFQTGRNTTEYSINAKAGSAGIEGYQGKGLFNQLRTAAIESMLDLQYQNLFEQTFVNVTRKALAAHQDFSTAIAGVPPLTTTFSNNYISKSFEMIAKTIAARKTLGMKRQTFFIMFGGWDHHDEVLNAQSKMLPIVSKALSEFNSALKEISMQNNVTTFTASDFGRTLTSNGQGSDHAWGGNQIVMGGAVKGKDIYGNYPSLYANNPLDTGRGRLIPTTSVDEFFAELALWFGVQSADLDRVLPNIGRFYSTSSNTMPVGFMNQNQTTTPLPPTGENPYNLYLPTVRSR